MKIWTTDRSIGKLQVVVFSKEKITEDICERVEASPLSKVAEVVLVGADVNVAVVAVVFVVVTLVLAVVGVMIGLVVSVSVVVMVVVVVMKSGIVLVKYHW